MGCYLTLAKTNASADDKKKAMQKVQGLKTSHQNPSDKDADGERHSGLPPSPNLTCTLRPGSEQERGNLADQSQYAVLWKWSVNEYS